MPPSGIFILDTILTGVSAWLVVCACGHARRGGLEAVLAWLWVSVAWIAAAGVVLGEIGQLHGRGFLLAHVVGLAVIGLARRRHFRADWAALTALGAPRYDHAPPLPGERVVRIALLAILAGLLVLAALAEPVVYDALTYRLPRIGAWLQDQRIHLLAATDPRLNYMPVAPDLVMVWLMTPTAAGYQGSILAQAIGGVLTLGATVGLARQTGLNRRAAWLAGALLLGMANVVVQFTSAHTDLFTTGIWAGAIYLWLCQLQRGEGSLLGGVGAGLALGSKGTIIYFAPGALLWVVWLAWKHPLPVRRWLLTVLAALVSGAFFTGPVFVRNLEAYGGLFGPKEYVQMHHQGAASASDWVRKIGLNLGASLTQLAEPNSQPLVLREAVRPLDLALAESFPEKDEFMFESASRRGTLVELARRADPDADAVSFGLIAAGLFLAGTIFALARRREKAAPLILVWSAGVVVFLVFFHVMQQWHPYGFRYFVLAAPWVAVVAAWGIEQASPRLRPGLWTLALLGSANVLSVVTMRTAQAGWRAITEPARSRGYFVAQHWRDWSANLDARSETTVVALPANMPLAAFYRGEPRRMVNLRPVPDAAVATAEEFVRPFPGWVIVPLGQFLGREGRVMASTWLFQGDENSHFSLAAYRRLAPNEKPPSILYRTRRSVVATGIEHSLLVKTWDASPVRLRLRNPAGQPRAFRLLAPGVDRRGELAAGLELVIELALPANAVAEVNLVFAASADASIPEATWELVR